MLQEGKNLFFVGSKKEIVLAGGGGRSPLTCIQKMKSNNSQTQQLPWILHHLESPGVNWMSISVGHFSGGGQVMLCLRDYTIWHLYLTLWCPSDGRGGQYKTLTYVHHTMCCMSHRGSEIILYLPRKYKYTRYFVSHMMGPIALLHVSQYDSAVPLQFNIASIHNGFTQYCGQLRYTCMNMNLFLPCEGTALAKSRGKQTASTYVC